MGLDVRLSISLTKLIWRKKSTLLGLLIVTLALGVFVRFNYQQFLYLQAQNISHLSVFNEIILPFAGLTVVCQLAVSLLVSVQLIPGFFASGQFSLLQQANLHPLRLLFSYLSAVLVFSLSPLIIFSVICSVLLSVSEIDLARLCITLAGLFIINLIVTQIILAVCINAKGMLLAIIQSISMMLIIVFAESGLSFLMLNEFSGLNWSGVFLPFLAIREGLFVYADWTSYLGWLVLSSSCSYFIICRQYKKMKRRAVAYISIGILVIFGSGFVSGYSDLTQSQRSSLSNAIKTKLSQNEQPLFVTAIINSQTNREEIMRGFKIIQSAFPSSELEFKSRQSLGPKIKHSGEYVEFNLGKLHQSVAYPFAEDVKSVFEAALHQMLLRKQQWITFIEGHGEASPLGKKSSDLAGFYQALTSMGWPVAVQNLTAMPVISDNTGLVVIASSKQSWTFKEQQIILSYLNNGGNLLLLTDPDSQVPEGVESFIGISHYDGTLVDWNGYQNGTPHPAVVRIIRDPLLVSIMIYFPRRFTAVISCCFKA